MPENIIVHDLFSNNSDLTSVLETIHAAFEAYRGKIQPESGALSETVENLADTARVGVILGILDGDRIAGCVRAVPKGEAFYLDRLAVHPDYQRRGYAKALVMAVEAEARRRGLACVTLGVRLTLKSNIALFANLGFSETGRSTHAGFDAPTSMEMEKRL